MKKAAVYLFTTFILLSMLFTMVPTAISQTDGSQDVKVLSYSFYVDNLGYLVVVGEVQNTGQNSLSYVHVDCTVYDVAGEILDNRGWYVYTSILLPQQKAPFYLQFPNVNLADNSNFDWTTKNVARFEFSTQATVTSYYQYPDIQITDASATIGNTADDKGVYWVNCKVQNTGGQTAENVTIIGTFYNANGTVVAVSMSDTVNPPSISPSKTASFKMGAWDRNQSTIPESDKIASYSLAIDILAPITEGTAPVITPAPTFQGTTDNEGLPLSNELLIGIVIAVIAVIVGAVLVMRKRKGSQQEDKKPKAKPTKKPDAKPKSRR